MSLKLLSKCLRLDHEMYNSCPKLCQCHKRKKIVVINTHHKIQAIMRTHKLLTFILPHMNRLREDTNENTHTNEG